MICLSVFQVRTNALYVELNHFQKCADNCSNHRFQKELAAEALRRNENDADKALDDLTNPETKAVLQVSLHVTFTSISLYFPFCFLFPFESNHCSTWFVE